MAISNECGIKGSNERALNSDIRKFITLSDGDINKFKDLIKEYRKQYSKDSTEDYVNWIFIGLSNNEKILTKKNLWISKDDLNTLFNSNNKPKSEEQQSKEEEISKDQRYFEDISDHFIDSVYGTSTAKDLMLKSFSQDIISSLFIDFENNREIITNQECNDNLIKYQESLFEILKEVYKKDLESIDSLFNQDGTNNLSKINFLLNKEKSKFNINKLQNMSQNALSRKKFKALNALFILNNFDRLLNLKYPKQITINTQEGILSNDPNKYTFEFKNTQINNTWRDDDKDIDGTKEVSHLIRDILETINAVDIHGNDIPNSYLSFQEISSINTLIRALPHHPEINKLFTLDNKQYNLKKLLLEADNNPIIGLKKLYDVIIHPKFPHKTFGIYKTQLRTIKAIHKRIFGNENSLYSIHIQNQQQTPHIDEQPASYYQQVIQILNSQEAIDLQEYHRKEGQISNITLKGQQEIIQTYSIDNMVGGYFSVSTNPKFLHFESNLTPLSEIKDNVDPELKITLHSEPSIVITRKKGGKIFINDKPIDQYDREELNKIFSENRDFFREVTRFVYSNEFINSLSAKESTYATQLIKMAASIIYNYEVSKQLLNINNSKEYNENKEKYFNEEENKKIKPYDHTKQLTYIPNEFTNIKIQLAKTRDEVNNVTRTNIQKDAENKQISSIGLDQIATKPEQQWERNTNDAIKNFTALKLFRGQEFARDFKGTENKAATKFTEAENFIANFMFDYLGRIYPNDGSDKTRNIIKILPSVISDKSRIPKTLFDLSQNSKYFKQDKNGNEIPMTYYDYDISDWQQMAVEELGSYYNSIYRNFQNTMKLANEALITILNSDSELGNKLKLIKTLEELNTLELDYDSNFQKFNSLVEKYIPKNERIKFIKDVLHEIALVNNDKNYELTQNIHYTITKGGKLVGNDLLYDQLYRWGVIDQNHDAYSAYNLSTGYGTSEEFFKAKQYQYIEDLLKDNCEILLHDSFGNKFKDTAYSRIPDEWKTSDNIIFAKIKYNYITENGLVNGELNITSKDDLKNSYIYRIIRQNPHLFEESLFKNELNINSQNFSLEKFKESIVTYNKNQLIPLIKKQVKNTLIGYNLSDEIINNLTNLVIDSVRLGNKISVTLKMLEDNVDSTLPMTITKALNNINLNSIKNLISQFDLHLNDLNSEFEMNEHLAKYQAMEFVLGQEYMNATMGTHLNHPGGGSNLKEKEATAWNAQVKRNVSMTASKYRFALDRVDGIKSQYNVAIIEDDRDIVYNIFGRVDKVKPYDGATFCSITSHYHENISLGSNKAGIDKKQFIHDYKSESGTGIIVKTAGFPITNGRMRNSEMLQGLNKKMLDIEFNTQVPINIDYNGEFLIGTRNGIPFSKYGDMTYVEFDENGEEIIYKTLGVKYLNKFDNTANIYRLRYNKITNQWEKANPIENINLNSNYKIWKYVFGGENSVTVNENGNYEFNECSCEQLAFAMSYVGTKKPGVNVVLKQSDVYQPLKEHVIDYIITEGAIKQGAANVNSKEAYFDDNFKLTTMKLNMYDAGIQLNAEHHADNSTLSLMTQVLNALSARGYSMKEGDEVYSALRSLTKEALKGFDLGLNGLKYDDSTEMQNFIADIVLRSIKTVGSSDGNLIAALSSEIKKEYAKGNKIAYNLIRKNMPLSMPAIFDKMSSSIASILTQRCIRIKFPGSMCVLAPSNRIYKIYADHLLSYYKGNVKKLPNISLKIGDKLQVGEIKMGRTYLISGNNFDATEILIDSPNDYWRIKELVSQGIINNIEEVQRVGRDLATYGARFTDFKGNVYNIWDLDSIKFLYLQNARYEELTNSIGSELIKEDLVKIQELENIAKSVNYDGDILDYKEFKNFLIKKLQNTLSSLSKQEYVKINRKDVKIYNLEIQPYELIAPKIYETTFGLKQGDDVQKISKDKLFFVRRMLENLASKAESRYYDVELSVLNGKHVYLLNSHDVIPSGLEEVNVEFQYDGDEIVQRDLSGKIIRKVSSMQDRIFVDNKGNEIIVTNNFNFYVDNTNFVQISLSEYNTENSLKEILTQLMYSDNKSVKNMLQNYFENIPDNPNLEALEQILEENKGNLLQRVIEGAKKHKENIEKLKIQLANKEYPNIEELKKIGHTVKEMIKKGLEIHTSFLQSLEFLAARIPAQSHQSFMAMKVVGFDESGKNTAYVSRMQIWLQGSDYDIDKVSLLGYKFKDGHFIKWSPYMDLSSKRLLEASKNIPFPTGNSVEIVEIQKDNIITLKFQELVALYNNSINQEEKIENLSKIINFINKLNFVPDIGLDSKKILNLVNKHNTYFKSKDVKSGLINFISSKMYLVSKDPVNLIQGQSPIDDMTEVIKELGKLQPMDQKAKTFAPGSPQSKLSMLLLTLKGKENTGIVASAMKNFEACSQYYYKILNSGTPEEQKRLIMNVEMFGREIRMLANAYSANPDSLESEVVNALNTVDNNIDAFLLFSAFLSLSTDNAKDPVLSKINAGPNMMGLYTAGLMLGFDVSTLVQIMTSPIAWEMSRLMESNVFNDTQGIFNIDGIFNYLSDGPIYQFKSLSKSLQQSIKNAIFLYLKKSRPIASAKLKSSDDVDDYLIKQAFRNPRFNLMKALNASYNDEQFKEFNLEELEKEILKNYRDIISDYNVKTQEIVDNIKKEIQELEQQLISETNESNKKELDKKLSNKRKKLTKYNNRIAENNGRLNVINEISEGKESTDLKLRSEVETYIQEVANTQFELQQQDLSDSFNYQEHDNIKVRRLIKEITKYRSFVRLSERSYITDPLSNKKYKTIDLIKKLSHVANEQSRLRPVLGLNQQLPNDIASQFKFLRNFEGIFAQRASELSPNNKAIEEFKEWNGDSLEISFNKFVTDENYRNDIIEWYERIKMSVNIFDVMANSEHYFGYMEALNANIELMTFSSTTYKIANQVSKDVFPKYFNVSRNGKLHEKYIKRVKKFVAYKINTQYLLSQDIIIKLPEDSKMIDQNGNIINSNGAEILLGTPEGNASFKYYMENYVIPQLQNEIGSGKFISDLVKINMANTFDGIGQVNYSLTESMMPKSDYERAIFKSYKDSLNSLQSKLFRGIPVLDLFFYYNLIAYNGESNQNSFTTLFEDIFAEKTSDTVNSYVKFYSVFDKEGNFELNKDFTEDELLKFIAPVENLESGKLKYIRVYNPDLMKIQMFKLKEKSISNENQDQDFDNPLVDQLEFENEFINEFENELENEEFRSSVFSFNDRVESSKYEYVEYVKKNYFTHDYNDLPERISLSGNISLNENKNIFTINGTDYTYNQLLHLAKANGHSVNNINSIIIKRQIRDYNGRWVEKLDVKQTLSRIEQILEDYC